MLRGLKSKKGQSTIETAFALPFLVWLIYYTINAFQFFHTAHVGQKFAAMSLHQRLSNQAKFVADGVTQDAHGREFMGVEYTDVDGGPVKRNLLDSGNDVGVTTRIGICKEPSCR